MPVVVPHHLTLTYYYVFDFRYKSQPTKESRLQYKCSSDPHNLNVPKMKLSLISLIALALTSTSVMAAAQPVPVEKRALDSVAAYIAADGIAKGRKSPQTTAKSNGVYKRGDPIALLCYTEKNTTPYPAGGDP
jgi:hypothetical protein